jgi:hypothetical protein
MIKLRMMGWMGHLAHLGEVRNSNKSFFLGGGGKIVKGAGSRWQVKVKLSV